jgi:hypothetical protein
MSAIEKWRGNLPGDPLERKIAKWRRQHGRQAPAPPQHATPPPSVTAPTIPVFSGGHGEPIDLLRRCAVHKGAFWFARYVWQNGRPKYVGSFAHEPEHQQQHAPENARQASNNFEPAREQCGSCRIWTPVGKIGSVFCTQCQSRVCFGRTSIDGYFMCWCGKESQLITANYPDGGIIPSLRISQESSG